MIAFINSLLSYLLVFFVFVCVIAVAVTVGITMRKKKNASEEAKALEEAGVETGN